MDKASFQVPTAFCEHCKYSIEQAVGNLVGVTGVEVDLPAHTVAVEYDPAAIEPEAIRRRIEGAGFPVEKGEGSAS